MDTLKYLAKKYKLNLSARPPLELPYFSRAHLAKLFAELGMTRGAEVGTWTGSYTARLCGINSGLKLIGVDLNSATPKKTLPNNCKLVRMGSLDAANKIVDGSLDFVYIDDHADLTGGIASIAQWSKKVRVGGIVSGFNYYHYRPRPHVHTFEAVQAYTGAYRVAPWFVTGQTTDRVRSWFWVKA